MTIGHQLEHERRDRDVDRTVGQRQVVSRTGHELDARVLRCVHGRSTGGGDSTPGELEHARGRITQHDRRRRPALEGMQGERAGARADVEHAQPGS